MPSTSSGFEEFDISELSAVSGVTVRNIRAYRAKGLLQGPERRGRASLYSRAHVTRLRTITALLERGYSIANIEELLNAWHAGKDLGGVLGLEHTASPNAEREAPEYMSLKELRKGYGSQLTASAIRRVVQLKLLLPRGTGFVAPRPKMIRVGIELTRIGVPLNEILDILAEFTRQIDVVTRTVVDTLDGAPKRGSASTQIAHVAKTASELRSLLDQAITLELADSFRRALEQRFGANLQPQLRPPAKKQRKRA